MAKCIIYFAVTSVKIIISILKTFCRHMQQMVLCIRAFLIEIELENFSNLPTILSMVFVA